jgi:pyridoxamine 5'-phosphate oxidase
LADSPPNPLAELRAWIEEAQAEGLAHPASVAFVTVGADGRPSARTVTVKRLEDEALIFTSALWTRKAREIEANPDVALLFHWPALGRQAHVTGTAALAERSLAEDLFAERDLRHQLQTVVSRQGEPLAAFEMTGEHHDGGIASGRAELERAPSPHPHRPARRGEDDDRGAAR